MTQDSGLRTQDSGLRTQDSGKKERDSSLELLRIVAMLMILFCHFTAHTGFNFSVQTITLNRLYIQFISMGGGLGNNIFFLISGYFLVKSPGVKIHRLIDLWLKMFFYSLVILLILTFLGVHKISWKDLYFFMPVIKMRWWFASAYFVLYLLHPYLNILLKSLSKEEYKKFLILIFICWSIIPTFLARSFCEGGFINFICLYSLAGYFRLWAIDFGDKKFIFYGIIFIFLSFLPSLCFDIIGLRIPYFAENALIFNFMMSPFMILGTLFLLLGFRALKLQKNNFINAIASATFGVYLIHEHELLKPFVSFSIFKNFPLQDSFYLIPYSIGVIFLFFAVFTLIELTRSKIFKFFSHGNFS